MVQLVEVPDEYDTTQQPYDGEKGNEDDAYYTDTDSSITDDDASDTSSIADLESETLYERLVALKDIVPPSRRAQLSSSFNNTYGFVSAGLGLGGKILWVMSTSALMLGVPYVLAWQEEQQVLEMEKEMQMQQNLNELITPGSKSSFAQEPPKR